MRAVIEAHAAAVREGARTALATLVCVEGSAYRRPGARMLVTNTGRLTGTLSGGCLERDVFEHALDVIKTRTPLVVRYDTGTDTDIVWGLGLGCNGVVQILIEPLDGLTPPAYFELLSRCIRRQESCVVATVFAVDPGRGSQAREIADNCRRQAEIRIGARLLLPAGAEPRAEFGNADLARAVTLDARRALRACQSCVRVYELGADTVSVFIEVIEPPVALAVFGANPDAAPVVAFAQHLGWHVTLVDPQARAASRERFADADALVLCRPEQVADHVALTPRTLALLMTHNYLFDLEILKTLLASPVPYIGMLGPRRRTEHIIAEAAEAGITMTDSDRQRLHAPVGLDLGAETPEEIALSIIAEIRAVLAGRQGGFLKDRQAPIHATLSVAEATEMHSLVPCQAGQSQVRPTEQADISQQSGVATWQ